MKTGVPSGTRRINTLRSAASACRQPADDGTPIVDVKAVLDARDR